MEMTTFLKYCKPGNDNDFTRDAAYILKDLSNLYKQIVMYWDAGNSSKSCKRVRTLFGVIGLRSDMEAQQLSLAQQEALQTLSRLEEMFATPAAELAQVAAFLSTILQMFESGIEEALKVLEDEVVRADLMSNIFQKMLKLELQGELEAGLSDSIEPIVQDGNFDWDKVRALHGRVLQMSDRMTRSWLRAEGLHPANIVHRLAELALIPADVLRDQ